MQEAVEPGLLRLCAEKAVDACEVWLYLLVLGRRAGAAATRADCGSRQPKT